jgi:hypothetical protein
VWGREVSGNPSKAKPRQINELTIHYTGAPSVNASADQIDERIKQTERGHKARPNENLSTIGYNFLIDEYGRIWEGRGFGIRNGANGSSSNNTSYSVCIIVGVKDNKISPVMVNSVRWLRERIERHTGNRIQVKGHRDHIPTSCPGESLYRQVRNGTFLQPSVPMEPLAPNPGAPAPAPAKPVAPGVPAAPAKPQPCEKRAVKRGDAGPCVKKVQQRLIAHGFNPGKADGKFGPKTEATVRSFQQAKRLKVDGVVGPKETWPALMRKPK